QQFGMRQDPNLSFFDLKSGKINSGKVSKSDAEMNVPGYTPGPRRTPPPGRRRKLPARGRQPRPVRQARRVSGPCAVRPIREAAQEAARRRGPAAETGSRPPATRPG